MRRAAPDFFTIAEGLSQRPYWTIEQSEWVTDIAFRSPEALAQLYPTLIRRGIETFASRDVLRFLGHQVSAQGRWHPRLGKEVVSDVKDRREGVRIKHRVGRNTLKMYDKFGQVLRVETTLNEVRSFKVFRRKDRQPEGPRQWLRLRKSVADMPRRALNPFSPTDAQLLAAVIRGEHALSGFRNRDLRETLYGATPDPAERRRQAARVTRHLSLLRAHGLLRKLPARAPLRPHQRRADRHHGVPRRSQRQRRSTHQGRRLRSSSSGSRMCEPIFHDFLDV